MGQLGRGGMWWIPLAFVVQQVLCPETCWGQQQPAPKSGAASLIPPHESLIVNGWGLWSVDGNNPFGWEALGGKCERAVPPGGHDPVFCVRGSDQVAAPSGSGFLSQGFPVFPEALYLASCRVKLVGATGVTHLVISWYSDQHEWIGNTDDGFVLSGDLDWTELPICDYPPPNAAYGRLALRSDDNAGTAWFREARVWISEPCGTVALPLPDVGPQKSASLIGQAQTAATYAPAKVIPAREQGEQAYEELWPPLTPAEGHSLPLSWAGVQGEVCLLKRFEAPHEPGPEAPWELRLVDCFLVATRWLLPVWLDDAAEEMFGSRERVLELLGQAAPLLAADAGNPHYAFALYLRDLWSADDPASLRQRSHDLALAHGTLDMRCDQILYLQEAATAAAAAHHRNRRLSSIEADLTGAAPAQRRRLLLERLRIHWEAGDYQQVVGDADLAIEAYGRFPVPGFVRLCRAEALLNLGELEAAKAEAARLEGDRGRGYAEEVARLLWYADIAAGSEGPRPHFVGDEEDADGLWPGRFGTAGAFITGPGASWDGYGAFERHGEVQIGTATLGVVIRTECRQFPSSLKPAPYQPFQLCRSDSYWDDRGEVWGRAIEGPDIVVRLGVPAGLFRASVLTGGYAVDLHLGDMATPLSSAPEGTGDPRLYRQFLVVGPAEYRLRLHRGDHLMTYLSGLFLDAVGPGPAPTGDSEIRRGRSGWKAWAEWEQRESEEEDPLHRLVRLTRHAFRPREGVLVEAAKAVLTGRDSQAIETLASKDLSEHPAALHALAEALASDEQRLKAIQAPALAGLCGRLAAAYDLPAIQELLERRATATPDTAPEVLSAVAKQAGGLESIVAVLSVLCKINAATDAERSRLAKYLEFRGRAEEAEAVRAHK